MEQVVIVCGGVRSTPKDRIEAEYTLSRVKGVISTPMHLEILEGQKNEPQLSLIDGGKGK